MPRVPNSTSSKIDKGALEQWNHDQMGTVTSPTSGCTDQVHGCQCFERMHGKRPLQSPRWSANPSCPLRFPSKIAMAPNDVQWFQRGWKQYLPWWKNQVVHSVRSFTLFSFCCLLRSIHSAGEANHFDRIASWCISNKIEDWESQTCACSRWPLAHAPKPGMAQSCHRWEGVYAWAIFVEKLRHFIQQGWDWSVGRDPTIWFRRNIILDQGSLQRLLARYQSFENIRVYMW